MIIDGVGILEGLEALGALDEVDSVGVLFGEMLLERVLIAEALIAKRALGGDLLPVRSLRLP